MSPAIGNWSFDQPDCTFIHEYGYLRLSVYIPTLHILLSFSVTQPSPFIYLLDTIPALLAASRYFLNLLIKEFLSFVVFGETRQLTLFSSSLGNLDRAP